jgi:metallo-beta-lactamase family protein
LRSFSGRETDGIPKLAGPKLVKDGFSGKIIASPPTVELCQIMLLDSAHVQEMDAEWQTRKNKRQGDKEVQPLYTSADAEESLKYFSPFERETTTTIEPGIRLRLRNAGHILGSSIAELWIEDTDEEIKIVFSGDLGNKNQLIVKDPEEILKANYLFVESTYGNRLHRTFEDSKEELLEAILHAVKHNEKVIIPAFALERTQEILYLLGEFHRDGSLPDIPVYLDSPLAIKATEIFRRNKKYYDEEARTIVEHGFDPFDMPNLRFTTTTAESIAINKNSGSAIIISASGMCTAGRIKHHLKHNLWRPGASIVIVGFQARGTTGRHIVDGAKSVKIFREDVAVRAKVFTIGGFSAHADQKGLLEWTSNFIESRPRVFIVHGELLSAQTLSDRIKEIYGMETYIPAWRETLLLEPGKMETEVRPAADIQVDLSHDMVNTIEDIEKELKGLKKRMKKTRTEGKIGEDDLERMKNIREQLQTLSSSSS